MHSLVENTFLFIPDQKSSLKFDMLFSTKFARLLFLNLCSENAVVREWHWGEHLEVMEPPKISATKEANMPIHRGHLAAVVLDLTQLPGIHTLAL